MEKKWNLDLKKKNKNSDIENDDKKIFLEAMKAEEEKWNQSTRRRKLYGQEIFDTKEYERLKEKSNKLGLDFDDYLKKIDDDKDKIEEFMFKINQLILLKKRNVEENIINEFENKIFISISNLVENKNFGVIKEISKKMLYENNIRAVEKLDINKPGDVILLTEAVNWAAKVINESFYILKPAMIISAWESGAILGIEKFENGRWPIYYLAHQDVGISSFHDPAWEVYKLAEKIGWEKKIEDWKYGWSGIDRQNQAFEIISAYQENSSEAKNYFRKVQYGSMPGSNIKEKYKNSRKFRK